MQESIASMTNPGVWIATRQSSFARQTHYQRRCAAWLSTGSPRLRMRRHHIFAVAAMSRTDDKCGFRAGVFSGGDDR